MGWERMLKMALSNDKTPCWTKKFSINICCNAITFNWHACGSCFVRPQCESFLFWTQNSWRFWCLSSIIFVLMALSDMLVSICQYLSIEWFSIQQNFQHHLDSIFLSFFADCTVHIGTLVFKTVDHDSLCSIHVLHHVKFAAQELHLSCYLYFLQSLKRKLHGLSS